MGSINVSSFTTSEIDLWSEWNVCAIKLPKDVTDISLQKLCLVSLMYLNRLFTATNCLLRIKKHLVVRAAIHQTIPKSHSQESMYTKGESQPSLLMEIGLIKYYFEKKLVLLISSLIFPYYQDDPIIFLKYFSPN